jgi:hypothetical protein
MTHLLGKKPVVGATIKSSTVGVNKNSYQGSAGFALCASVFAEASPDKTPRQGVQRSEKRRTQKAVWRNQKSASRIQHPVTRIQHPGNKFVSSQGRKRER